MDRVFLDANVLFSAAYREQNGLLRFWSLPDTELCTSAYAADEARRNLADPAAQQRLDQLLAVVRIVAESLSASSSLPAGVELPAKDVPILLAAVACRATHLVTGDVRHFGRLFDQSIGGATIQLPASYLDGRVARQSAGHQPSEDESS